MGHELAEKIFELDAGAGFGVAVFDDYSATEGESPLFAGGVGDGAGAGYDYRIFGDDQRLVAGCRVDGVANEIVDGDRAVEDCAGAENGAAFDNRAFINSGVPTNYNIVFNNHGKRAYWLEDSADLRAGGDVAIAADLRAGADEGVGIDHGVFPDEGTDVDEHGGHADYAAGDVSTVPNAGTSRDDTDAVGGGEGVKRVGGFVKEGELCGIDRHIHDRAHAKAEEYAFFHPGVGAPSCGRRRVRFGSANCAAIQRILEGCEEGVMFRGV